MAERAYPEWKGYKDRWFGLRPSKYKKHLYNRYYRCNPYIKGKVILDIPCGAGWGTSLLEGAKYIIGIDISSEAIDYAKQNYLSESIEYKIGNMNSIPLSNNMIDIVICLEGLEHISKTDGLNFIKESSRVLKHGGLMILTCPVLNNMNESTGNPYHLYEYPEKELINLLNMYYQILLLKRVKGCDGPEYYTILRKND